MALVCDPNTSKRGLCLDLKVNIPSLIAIGGLIVTMLSFGLDLQHRVESLEVASKRFEHQGEQIIGGALKMERLETRIDGIESLLRDIRDELKRQRKG
ncbi:hypothetical protein [Desulfovibrio inopinatus]|uniref:hypothetical protein n=1 Tax=Desulfovibrio inopinatus TaxID=102109 RepID=UPI000409A060|nr:hypothetical protein [Desulfovibrio inopinatus]